MISSQTSNLVIDSFRAISLEREALIQAFYERLFSKYPATQAIFAKVDKVALRRKLLLALITIVDSLEDNEQLFINLQSISGTHVRHHIEREHYEMFGEVLIETLAAFLPESWNEATALAWQDALEHVTDMIITIGEHER